MATIKQLQQDMKEEIKNLKRLGEEAEATLEKIDAYEKDIRRLKKLTTKK